MSPDISVIMPLYNAKKYLKLAVDSILNQTHNNLEVVIVDDCSTDGSLELCRELYGDDSRVVLLQQPQNSGPGNARNSGIKHAHGKYIAFADSDDRLTPDACRTMIDAIGEKDLVIAHYYLDVASAQFDRGLLKGSRDLSEWEFLEELVKRPGSFYFSALWNKMYRSSLIHQLKLQFDPFLSWGEDFAFNMEYNLAVLHGVALVDKPVYHYVKNPGSTSIRTLFHVGHSFQIKARLYRRFKSLYVKKGLYVQHRFRIWCYIWNVTLAD